MCMVVYELKKGNPTGLIWAKPLMVWMPFIARKKLLYGKSSSSSGTIPNFCLSSQPSGIPLILHGLPFGFQPIEALYIVFHYYFHFCFLDMAAREASVASTSNHTPQHFGLLTSSKWPELWGIHGACGSHQGDRHSCEDICPLNPILWCNVFHCVVINKVVLLLSKIMVTWIFGHYHIVHEMHSMWFMWFSHSRYKSQVLCKLRILVYSRWWNWALHLQTQ